MKEPGDITILLRKRRAGEQAAEAELIERVYAELKHLAAAYLRGERNGHTLQPTALVHEAYIRICGGKPVEFVDRIHFFAVAARIMRRLLADHGRRRRADKHGAKKIVSGLDSFYEFPDSRPMTYSDLDEAIEQLALSEPRQAAVVEMRFFGGMPEQEIAVYLKVSDRTVKRDWTVARATLFDMLGGGNSPVSAR